MSPSRDARRDVAEEDRLAQQLRDEREGRRQDDGVGDLDENVGVHRRRRSRGIGEGASLRRGSPARSRERMPTRGRVRECLRSSRSPPASAQRALWCVTHSDLTDPTCPVDSTYDRRAFMAYFTSLGLGSTLLPGVLWAQANQQAAPITREMVPAAEQIAGLEFTDEERTAIANGLGEHAGDHSALHASPAAECGLPVVRVRSGSAGREDARDREGADGARAGPGDGAARRASTSWRTPASRSSRRWCAPER